MVSERIRNLILGDQLTRDERETLEEWLADCDDDESELEPDDEM